jgi:hypothetical protein
LTLYPTYISFNKPTNFIETVNISKTSEKIYSTNVSISSTFIFNYDWDTMKSVNYLTSVATNFTMNITNLPLPTDTTSYTITLIITSKYYATSLTLNGGSQSVVYAGGSSNIIIPNSTDTIIQTFTLFYSGSNLLKIISSVTPYF